jgi:putative transposase
MVSPSWRRKAVQHLVRHFHVSVRRACRVLGQHRSTQTYEAVPADYQLRLVKRMNELAAAHPKYGYRIVANLLQAESWKVNKKRVARLWRLERNQVPPKRKSHPTTRARGASINAAWRLRAGFPNHIWGMDFMSGKTTKAGAIRILNIVCELTRGAGLPGRHPPRDRRGDRRAGEGVRQIREAQDYSRRQRPGVHRGRVEALAH